MQRDILRKLALAVILFWAVITLLYAAFGSSFVEACYRGESIGVLNRIVARHRSLEPEAHDLKFYQQKAISVFIEVSLLLGFVGSYLLLEARRPIFFEQLKAAIRNFFLCGIPQSYGKIDFYHFMIWFALLLSLSRCADVLSFDALLRALKRRDRTVTTAPKPSLCYGLPLKFVWILMGVNYFFGGLWKLIDGRWNWLFGENLRYHIYNRWYVIDRIPHFAHFLVNQQRWFFQVGAVTTIAFELSFIALVLFPRTRILAAIGGLFFLNVLGL